MSPEASGPWSFPDTSYGPEHRVLPDGPGDSLYPPSLQTLHKGILCLWSHSVGTDVLLLFPWQRDQKGYLPTSALSLWNLSLARSHPGQPGVDIPMKPRSVGCFCQGQGILGSRQGLCRRDGSEPSPTSDFPLFSSPGEGGLISSRPDRYFSQGAFPRNGGQAWGWRSFRLALNRTLSLRALFQGPSLDTRWQVSLCL